MDQVAENSRVQGIDPAPAQPSEKACQWEERGLDEAC